MKLRTIINLILTLAFCYYMYPVNTNYLFYAFKIGFWVMLTFGFYIWVEAMSYKVTRQYHVIQANTYENQERFKSNSWANIRDSKFYEKLLLIIDFFRINIYKWFYGFINFARMNKIAAFSLSGIFLTIIFIVLM